MKNNKNRKELVTMAVLTIIISAGVTTAFAHRGLDPEVKKSIDTAIESGNYQAWVDLHPEDGRMMEAITEENFGQLQAMHEARQSGDFEKAEVIEEELGLPGRTGGRYGQGMFPDPQQHEAIQAALDNNDYQAWLASQPEGSKMVELINQDNFSKLVAMHEAMQDNDWTTAKQLKEELGLYKMGGNKMKAGRGMHNNFQNR